MIRTEWMVAGCILVVIGFILCLTGYNKNQMSTSERVLEGTVSFLEELSGEKAPAELKKDKSVGYMYLGGGAICILIGIGVILKSRGDSARSKSDE